MQILVHNPSCGHQIEGYQHGSAPTNIHSIVYSIPQGNHHIIFYSISLQVPEGHIVPRRLWANKVQQTLLRKQVKRSNFENTFKSIQLK
jgi:hypothetical protein